MRKNIVGVAVVTLLGSLATAAIAFCQPGKCVLKDGKGGGPSAGCIGQCTHPCDPATCDHRCTPGERGKTFVRPVADETASGGQKPCGAKGKGATTVAGDRPPDHKKVTFKSEGEGGGKKPCHAKGKATLTADKAESKDGGKKPGHAKGKATLTADKAEGKGGCGKSREGKGKAALTADKARGKGGCNKPCHGKGKATLTADKANAGSKPCPLTGKPLPAGADCPIDAILASMPSMRYRVGKDETCCAKSAKNLAEKAGAPVQYVVGDTVFPDQQAATVELTKQLATEADKLGSLQFVADGKGHFCPMSAKDVAKKTKTTMTYRVGGFDFTDKPEAEKAIKLVADATKKVQMTYKVGEKVYHCGKTAKSKADGNGHKLTYVVGKDETCCEVSAGLSLAWAKIRAIVETAAGSSTS